MRKTVAVRLQNVAERSQVWDLGFRRWPFLQRGASRSGQSQSRSQQSFLWKPAGDPKISTDTRRTRSGQDDAEEQGGLGGHTLLPFGPDGEAAAGCDAVWTSGACVRSPPTLPDVPTPWGMERSLPLGAGCARPRRAAPSQPRLRLGGRFTGVEEGNNHTVLEQVEVS